MRTIYKTMDPLEIQNRFSTEKNFLYPGECNYEDFQPFLDRLPQRERDLVEMYYRRQKKQKEIAIYFGVTQGAISHRLSRARSRLEFLRDMPKLTVDIRKLLGSYFSPFEIDIIIFMVQTTCQSKTADLLNKKYDLDNERRMTQVKVRHKFDRCIDKLRKLKRQNNEIKVCHKLAEYIRENLYMMHEVILPHFGKGHHVRYEGMY